MSSRYDVIARERNMTFVLGWQESFVVFFQNFYFISFFKTTN